jgi:hypothetical protein
MPCLLIFCYMFRPQGHNQVYTITESSVTGKILNYQLKENEVLEDLRINGRFLFYNIHNRHHNMEKMMTIGY